MSGWEFVFFERLGVFFFFERLGVVCFTRVLLGFLAKN